MIKRIKIYFSEKIRKTNQTEILNLGVTPDVTLDDSNF